MDMNLQINRLLNFALQQGLIAPEDKYYSANLLLDLLGVDEFEVIEVDGAELGRGRGGPRCMSMPLVREDIY